VSERQTEREKVKLQRIRSSEAESQKMAFGSRQFKVETAIRSSKAEKAKLKAKAESKSAK